MTYSVVKSIHLIGIVAWFAGLFYIFRLYVYHRENQDHPEIVNLFEVMERRLYYAITWPAMMIATSMGVWLIVMNPGIISRGWFHVKLLFLFLLYGYHFFSGYVYGQFKQKNFFLTSKQCRMINEVPTLVLIVVVPLAVLKLF